MKKTYREWLVFFLRVNLWTFACLMFFVPAYPWWFFAIMALISSLLPSHLINKNSSRTSRFKVKT